VKLRLPILIVLLAVGVWILPRVAPLAKERAREFLVDPIHLQVASAPDWFAATVEPSLRAELATLAPTPLRDDDEVLALAHAIERSSGWVRSVDRLEKRYPNQLEVELSLREPVAMVESGSGLVLVDADGVIVAPATDSADFLASHDLPLVHGPRALRDATPGARVRDAQLEEGLRVAVELLPHRATLAERELHLDVIDVTAQQRGAGRALTDVELYTRQGLAIEWGRASTNPKLGALEPAADAKVRGLLRLAARYPELAGIRRIRLQFDKPYVVFAEDSPLAYAPAGARTP